MEPIELVLPIRTKSEANQREHWAVKAKRVKQQRYVTALLMRRHRRAVEFPCTVTLTRVAPRALDSDNLAISNKAIRDAIAASLGIDDRDPCVTWEYAQEKSKVYGVRVRIEGRTK